MRKRSEGAGELVALHTTPMKTFGQKALMISIQPLPNPGSSDLSILRWYIFE